MKPYAAVAAIYLLSAPAVAQNATYTVDSRLFQLIGIRATPTGIITCYKHRPEDACVATHVLITILATCTDNHKQVLYRAQIGLNERDGPEEKRQRRESIARICAPVL